MLQNPDAKADEVFVRCKPGLAVDSSHSTVTLADNRSVKVPTADIFAANPDGLVTPDNTMLIHLSEPTILANVRSRFESKDIYTLTGSILLAMNPFEKLPIYTEATMSNYKGKRLGAELPHIYGTAEAAYQMLAKVRSPLVGHAIVATLQWGRRVWRG